MTVSEGVFKAKEILTICPNEACKRIVGSGDLHELVMPRHRFGYDLIVHVGLARYLGGMQRGEIQAELLKSKGIRLSVGSISHLCDRFLTLFEALHLSRVPQLKRAMEGGNPLHIDATCDAGKGGLFVCIDGWRQWVLQAGRITTESAEQIKPIVDRTIELFGDPIATMRDLGEPGALAVLPLRERGVVDLVCHRHFLAAVGKKLLEKPYSTLRLLVHSTGVRSQLRIMLRELRQYHTSSSYSGRFGEGRIRQDLLALILWLLEATGGKDAEFPFALSHLDFVHRCMMAVNQAQQWVPYPRTEPERRALRYVSRLIARLKQEGKIRTLTQKLDTSWQAFTELRDMLRLAKDELICADSSGYQRNLPQVEVLRLAQIRQELINYKQDLTQQVKNKAESTDKAADYFIILQYLQKYGPSLFGHPICRDDVGAVIAIVDRTNNIPEHLFGYAKQLLRRRVGRAKLARDLQQQPAQVALVANLHYQDYMRVLCGSLENLPSVFAELDNQTRETATPIVRDHRDKQLHKRINQLLEAQKQGAQAHSAKPVEPDLSKREQSLTAKHVKGISVEEMRNRCGAVFTSIPKRKTPHTIKRPASNIRDPQLPPVGQTMSRVYRGVKHDVLVVDNGFEYQGKRYGTLSSIVKVITGYYQNAFDFFNVSWRRQQSTILENYRRRNVSQGGSCYGQSLSHAMKGRDLRLPDVGEILTRFYKGVEHTALVLAKGFVYKEQTYKSLTAVVRAITGSETNRNGFEFFNLGKASKQEGVPLETEQPAEPPVLTGPKPRRGQKTPKDHRIPAPGYVITRKYLGIEYRVTVLEKGFEYQGKTYKSLSPIANAITGSHWNGFIFFHLHNPAESSVSSEEGPSDERQELYGPSLKEMSDSPPAPLNGQRDSRLPPTGEILRRIYNGIEYEVEVLEGGFRLDGQDFKSLTKIAREITGNKWNGFTFFNLGKPKPVLSGNRDQCPASFEDSPSQRLPTTVV